MQIALPAEISDPYSVIHWWSGRKAATERAIYVILRYRVRISYSDTECGTVAVEV